MEDWETYGTMWEETEMEQLWGQEKTGKIRQQTTIVDSCEGKTKKRNLVLRGRQEFKRESIIFEKAEQKRELLKNLDSRGIMGEW